jgi:hypothetical protein
MKDLTSLTNHGWQIIGEPTEAEQFTCIVVGVARSGTSIVAGSLHQLGLFMGDNCEARPSFEDPAMRSSILQQDWPAARELISVYNKRRPGWGTKLPALVEQLDFAHDEFRNPRYVIIFRDIFSIANRNRISMKSDLVQDMHQSILQYQKIIDFIRSRSPHALLIAHSFALDNKPEFIDRLVEFCQLNPSKDQIRAAHKFIQRNPETYLQLSRITKSEGKVLHIGKNMITGWAKYSNTEATATVVLSISGQEVARQKANLCTEELGIEGAPEARKHGFRFYLNSDKSITGSAIEVRVSDDIENIPNCAVDHAPDVEISKLERKGRNVWRRLFIKRKS